MSDSTSPVGPEHIAYLAARTGGDDELLRDLKGSALEQGLPAIWIAPEQASLMQILLRSHRARVVVEVGTLGGYSAIQMARALEPGGVVHTIELDEAHVRFAREWISKAGLQASIEVYHGAGLDVLPRFADESCDAAFVDADKAHYSAYLRECLRILRPGGLLMVDNAFAFGRILEAACEDPDVLALRAFNDEMARKKQVKAIIVPIGDGLWVGTKVQPA